MYSTGPRLLALAALAALALALGACGGGSETAGAAASAEPKQKVRGTDPVCLNQLGGFLGSLDRLRDQLVAGVTYVQYIDELNDVRAAYARLPVRKLRLGCLRRVGTVGEQALNRYIAAAETWSDCVEVPGCPSSSIEGELQRKWRQASRLLSRAEDGRSGR